MLPHAYPRALADFVRRRWSEVRPIEADAACALPPPDALEELISTAYQATLLREEERPVTFRIIVGHPEEFPEHEGPPEGLHRLTFTKPRPFTEHELRRLSPAAKYQRALIGVERVTDGLQTWGLLQSGPRWLEGVRGGRKSLPNLPASKLIVRATGPGRIAIASGPVTLGEIRGGRISEPNSDAFESQWLPKIFHKEKMEMIAAHKEARAKATEPWRDLDLESWRTISQQMMKRVVATMRSAHHGGTLLVLPTDRADELLKSGLLRTKYTFQEGPARRRYRTLMQAALEALVRGQNGDVFDEAIFEIAALVASLADVDGAVVLNKRFEILGFGAEIGGEWQDAPTVMRALDLEGEEREEELVDGVGTRHRSAYRLISREREALALVVSQDGSARFIAWKGDAVTYWDHVSVGSPEG